MTTLNYKVLFKNISYWLELSTVAWPSTGSTSTMIVTFSTFVTLPFIQLVIMYSIFSIVVLTIFFGTIYFRPGFRNLFPRIAYTLGSAILFSNIAAFALKIVSQDGPLQHNELSLKIPYALTALAMLLSAFHLIGYTKTTNQ
jgi:hypothetical protein